MTAILAFGLRLAVGGGRNSLARLALVAAGVGFGVALLLGGLGAGPAREARQARELAREPALGSALRPPPGTSYVLQRVEVDRFRGRRLLRMRLAGVGKRPPVPPGLRRLPRAGELAVSPAVARLLRAGEGALLRPRLPGRVVGVLAKDGLAWPGDLVAYSGVGRGEATAAAGFFPVTEYRAEAARERPLPAEIKLVIILAVLGLLVPTLAFIAASSRVAAAARERRLAAMRLVGATPGQVRLLAAVESAVAALAGCLTGMALFFALRPHMVALAPPGHEVFAADIAPPLAQAAVVLLAVPLLAVGASLLALQRVELNPLGIVRHARVRRAGPLRALPLVLGFAALAVAWLNRDDFGGHAAGGRGDTLTLVLVGMGFVLVLFGVAAVTPWLSLLAARLLARATPNVGTLIAARRLIAEPTAAARLVSGAVLAVFVATVAHAFLPQLVGATGAQADAVAAARPGTLFVGTPAPPREFVTVLRDVPGVRTVAPVGAASAVSPVPESGDVGSPAVLVADCAALNRVLVEPLPRCGTAGGYRLLPPSPYAPAAEAGATLRLLVDPDRSDQTVAFRVPDTLTAAAVSRPLLGDDVALLVPPEVVPPRAALHTRLGLVATDGADDTVERVRNALARASIFADVSTADEYLGDQSDEMRGVVALIDLVTLLVLSIAAAGLVVASIDSVLDRRRPLAVLAAVGTPVSLLRRAVLLQTAVPLACGLAVAAATAVLASLLVLSVNGAALVLPLNTLGALAAGAVASVLGIVALTLPTLGRAVRPETLRSE